MSAWWGATHARTRSRALELLEEQLREITTLLPEEPLNAVMTVPIWLSPEYDGVRPTAEYHPGAGWLARVGRRPELVHCVELTNVRIFGREYKRMPMMIFKMIHRTSDTTKTKTPTITIDDS